MSAFAINFFGTIARWRERHIYVAIWFWIATVVTIAMLHVFKDLVVPAGLFKSTRSDETGEVSDPTTTAQAHSVPVGAR